MMRSSNVNRRKIYGFLGVVLVLAQPFWAGGNAFANNGALSAPGQQSNSVSEWNAIAEEILQPSPMPGMPMTMTGISMTAAFVYLAYVQAAVYDALVAIEGGYQPYAYQGGAGPPDASREAAVAAAAYTVLKHYLPDQPSLDGKYDAYISAIPESTAKSEGIAAGQAAADAIIALRADDGLLAEDTYTLPEPGPGVWEPTMLMPDGVTLAPPVDPWMALLKPFLRATPDEYRPGPPPALTSAEYAADLNEVKDVGGAMSISRTPEQTEVARFWTTNMVIQTNAAYRRLAAERSLGLLDTARLMAMGNMAATDSLIATFDAKYTYNFWRPVTAIRRADTDGNDATAPDPTWMPAVMTPNFPEYVAGHGSFVSAQAEVFTRFFGTPRIEIDLDSSITGTTRHYATADDLRTEIVNARTWGGLHFRNSSVLAVDLGERFVKDALESSFLADPASGTGNHVVFAAHAPAGRNEYRYHPVGEPEVSTAAQGMRPFAIGEAPENITLRLRLAYTDPIDVYVGLAVPGLEDVWLIGPADVPSPLSAGPVKWKENSYYEKIDHSFFGPIPTDILPAGIYRLYAMVTPAGDTTFENYDFWETYFEIRPVDGIFQP